MTTYLHRYVRFPGRFLGSFLGPVLGVAAILAANQVHALSLGNLEVLSALDEPLIAEIELNAVEDGTLDSLQIKLGSPDAFNQAGIPRKLFLRDLEFSLVKGPQPKVRIATTQPVKEPFLHFLVNAEWDDGNLLREYTALLDPPLYAASQPTAVSSPGVVVQTEKMAASEPTTSASGASSSGGAESPQSGSVSVFGGAEYGPTEKGDTLWSIASQFDPSGYNVNVFQVMAALLKENPDAFIDNNVNRMKTGQILRLSNLDAVGKEDASQMYQAQLDQWEAYKMEVARNSELVNVPAGPSVAKPDALPAAPKSVESGSAAMAAGEAEKPTTPASEQDLLKIVRATLEVEGQSESVGGESATDAAQADSGKELDALRAQISTLEESLVSTELQNRELQGRVVLLEDQVVSAQRLIELESQELALVQEQAAQQQEERRLLEQQLMEQQIQADQIEADQIQADQIQADQIQADQARADQIQADQIQADQARADQIQADQIQAEADKAAAEQAAADTAQAESAAANQQAAAAKAEAEKIAAEQKAAAEKALAETEGAGATQQGVAASGQQATSESTAQEQSAPPAKTKKTRIDSRQDNTATAQQVSQGPGPKPWWQNILDIIVGSSMSLIAGVAGLGVLLVAAILFIRRRRSIAEFEESILSGSGLDGQTDTTDTAAANPGTDTSFLSDFGMAGMGSMQADEVDPLAEADVYLAYGRDEQAEEVLKEAATHNPARHELKLKLLEIYQQRNDLKSFETLAEELYPAGGQGDPVTWAKVVKMGNKMNPHNPLFAQELSGGMADAATSDDSDGAESINLDLSDLPTAATMSDVELPQNIIGQSSGPIDPALHPFPPPDQNAGVEEEFDREDAQADATAVSSAVEPDEPKPLSQSEDKSEDKSVEDNLLDFATDSPSELDFDIDIDSFGEGPKKDVDAESDELPDLDIGAPKLQTNSLGADDAQDEPSGDDKFVVQVEDADDKPAAGEPRLVPKEGATRNFGVIEGGNGTEETAGDGGGAEHGATDTEVWDEASTKLDLAQAYLNMGDKAGARSIIDEVIKEGSPAQKDQAAELQAQLG